jgi:hypothetical protein
MLAKKIAICVLLFLLLVLGGALLNSRIDSPSSSEGPKANVRAYQLRPQKQGEDMDLLHDTLFLPREYVKIVSKNRQARSSGSRPANADEGTAVRPSPEIGSGPDAAERTDMIR